MHGYQAETDVELTLSVGDYVVIRKVYCFSSNFWLLKHNRILKLQRIYCQLRFMIQQSSGGLIGPDSL